MIRNFYLSALLLLLGSSLATAQEGGIKGTVTDEKTKQGIPFANVILEKGGTLSGGAQTDFDGNYVIKPVSAGTYDVKISFVGYQPKEISGVIVSVDKMTFLDIVLSSTVTNLKVFEKIDYKVPIIDKGNPSTQSTMTSEDIQVAPTRDINSLASTTAGIYQADEGREINMRGARSDATQYVVDGIKVNGAPGIASSGIDQITVITGGLPANYGDATGGVISITTKGPSRQYSGGLELVTSELFDSYGYNLASLNLSGPLISKKEVGSKTKKPIAGFFIVAEYEGDKDGSPSAKGTYQVKPDVLADLQANPLRPKGVGVGFNDNSDYIHLDQLDHLKYKANAAGASFRMSGKFDFKPSANTNVTLGGSFDHGSAHTWQYVYSVYNADNNPQDISNNYRVFARFTQKFTNDSAYKGVIKNAYYSIQADYSLTNSKDQDDTHKDNLFNYGYIGKFKTYKGKFYNYGSVLDSASGHNYTGWILAAHPDTLVTFEPSDINPVGTNYTTQYYALSGADIVNNQFENVGANVDAYRTLSDIQNGGGLLNGERPNNVLGLWYNTGRQWNGYSYSQAEQFRVTASGSADVKNHAIIVGFEYEQRSERGYSVAPIGLWSLMRQLANKHLSQLDLAHPQFVMDANGVFQDTINYNLQYSAADQSFFDKNLRKTLGLPVNGLDWIDIDSYSPETFKLDMFSADELLNNGGSYVSYYGYDYLGKKLTHRPSFSDFFTKKDANDNFTREIGAFEPIYVAGYIQDRFAFNDLIFNVGIRVDRFDANQKVLKDPYLLYASHTAGDDMTKQLLNGKSLPDNIGSDYTVYVNDLHSPTAIVGYRSLDKWYDATGQPLTDPMVLGKATSTGTIIPYVVNPDENIMKPNFVPDNSFKDYEPQTTIMPRIAFSFPISDEALFFAHYDVLTQRPPNALRMAPTQYFYLQSLGGGTLDNPDLKPQRTTDYELGFKQKLTRSSAVTISAFYRELRDMIQVIQLTGAYPVTYNSFGNIDFGTTKGLTVAYDLRRTNNVRLTANYSLQFADGTGSGATSGFNIVNSGQPNLRTPIPLDFDQRHTLTASVDYRYGSGQGEDVYTGPILFGKKIFSATGLNLLFRAGSGVPYTRQLNITKAGAIDENQKFLLAGSINGSRLPWQFRIDTKIDKDINLKFGKKAGEDKKYAYLNVYIMVQNLLNAENILSVYHATGNPNDDGYLSAAEFQADIAKQVDPQAYRDLYSVKIDSPGNYSLPRRVRLGLSLNF